MFGDQTNLPESLSKNRTCKPTCSSLASMFSSKNEANFILTVQIHCLYRLSFHVCLEEAIIISGICNEKRSVYDEKVTMFTSK